MRSIVLIVTIAALAGCQARTTDNASAVAGSGNTTDMTPEGPGLTAQLFGGGKPMPMTVQRQFENGAILYVTSMQAKPTETVLGVKIVNGSERDLELNWADKKTYLVAGGQKFFVSPPMENTKLSVTAGSTMDGQLVFLGTLPQSGAVTLVVNDGMNDGKFTRSPNASIALPATSAAWSDDGSKKNSAA